MKVKGYKGTDLFLCINPGLALAVVICPEGKATEKK